jgi:hypothetical protein
MSNAIANQLFLAYLGRPADTQWRNTTGTLLNSGPPSTALQTAFFNAAVADGVFATTDSPSVLVNKIFNQIFGFSASTFEQNAWGNLITTGAITAQTAAWTIFSSYLGATNVPDAYKIPAQSKLIAADAYVTQLGNDAAANAALSQAGSSAASSARTFLTGVTTQATAATAVTGIATTVSSLATSTTGQTFTLTTNIDSFTGGSGNDIIQGAMASLGALDVINGGAGTDTLSLALTGNLTLASSQITNIETLSLTTNATAAVTLTGITGLTSVSTNGNSGGALTVGVAADSLASATTAVTIANTSQNTTLVWTEASIAGTSDAAAITVNGVTGAAQVNVDTQTANTAGFETINLVASGTTSSITLETNDTAGLATLNISGSAAVTVALGTNMSTTARTISASAATGNVAVSGLGAAVHTVTGGTGNDTFTFGANYIGAEAAAATRDTVNGGAGTDTLSMTIARAVAASTTAQTNVTNIETLSISDAWTDANSFDVTKFSGVTTLSLAANTAGTSTATVAAGTTVTLRGDTAANSVTSFTVDGTGTTDTLTLNMAGFDFAGTGTETFNGVETFNINTGSTVTDAATFANALTVNASAGGQSTITATGANALTFTGNITGVVNLNASALTGVLTVSGTAGNAMTITGGTKGDTINGSASADLITGGEGADTITGRAGNDTIALAETTAAVDIVVFSATTTNGIDTITGFTAGGTTTSDDLNVVAMTAAAITAGTLISSAAAADTTADRKNFLQVINTDGTAASVTTGGSKTLAAADLTATTLTNVAAFIAEKYTGNSSTTDADTGVYAINWTASGSTTTYIYQWDNDTTANVTQAGELALVGIVNRGTTTLVNADFVIA